MNVVWLRLSHTVSTITDCQRIHNKYMACSAANANEKKKCGVESDHFLGVDKSYLHRKWIVSDKGQDDNTQKSFTAVWQYNYNNRTLWRTLPKTLKLLKFSDSHTHIAFNDTEISST